MKDIYYLVIANTLTVVMVGIKIVVDIFHRRTEKNLASSQNNRESIIRLDERVKQIEKHNVSKMKEDIHAAHYSIRELKEKKE